jgi:flagellar basal body-associated protein FliL
MLTSQKGFSSVLIIVVVVVVALAAVGYWWFNMKPTPSDEGNKPPHILVETTNTPAPATSSAKSSEELVKVENNSYVFYHPKGFVQPELVGPILQEFQKDSVDGGANIYLIADINYPTASFKLEGVCQGLVNEGNTHKRTSTVNYNTDKTECTIEQHGPVGYKSSVAIYYRVMQSPKVKDYLEVVAQETDPNNSAEFDLLKKAADSFVLK